MIDEKIEAERARKRAYYHANKERMREQNRIWHKANPDRAREIARRAYARKDKAKIAEHSRMVRQQNPERNRQATRRWREKNLERHKAMVRDWAARNQDARQAASARRRARKADGPGVTRAEWAEIKSRFSGCCAYCLQPFARLTMDHVVPLARGGKHEPDNIVPACGSCNRRKHTKPATAFAAEMGRLL